MISDQIVNIYYAFKGYIQIDLIIQLSDVIENVRKPIRFENTNVSFIFGQAVALDMLGPKLYYIVEIHFRSPMPFLLRYFSKLENQCSFRKGFQIYIKKQTLADIIGNTK